MDSLLELSMKFEQFCSSIFSTTNKSDMNSFNFLLALLFYCWKIRHETDEKNLSNFNYLNCIVSIVLFVFHVFFMVDSISFPWINQLAAFLDYHQHKIPEKTKLKRRFQRRSHSHPSRISHLRIQQAPIVLHTLFPGLTFPDDTSFLSCHFLGAKRPFL